MTGPRLDGTKTPRIDRRTQLLATASRLFSERTYDEVTTTEIAKRAGVDGSATLTNSSSTTSTTMTFRKNISFSSRSPR